MRAHGHPRDASSPQTTADGLTRCMRYLRDQLRQRQHRLRFALAPWANASRGKKQAVHVCCADVIACASAFRALTDEARRQTVVCFPKSEVERDRRDEPLLWKRRGPYFPSPLP